MRFGTGLVLRFCDVLAEVLVRQMEQHRKSRPSFPDIPPNEIDRDTVVWAYRLLLGRNPQSERDIRLRMALRDTQSLVKTLLDLPECQLRPAPQVKDVLRQKLPTPKYVLTEFDDGTRFWINLQDIYISEWLLRGQTWEPMETAFVRRVVKPGMHALDIGANLGWFAVQMAALVGTEGLVTAFEPRNDIHHYLRKTITANNLGNVTVHNVALGAGDGELMLAWDGADENPGHTQLAPDLALDAAATEDRRVQKTPVRRLDTLVSKRVDFIKIDVEGAEKLVFDGAPRILDADRPVILSEIAPQFLLEVSDIAIGDYFAYLAARRYRVFELTEDGGLSREITAWTYEDNRLLINVALVPAEKPLPA